MQILRADVRCSRRPWHQPSHAMVSGHSHEALHNMQIPNVHCALVDQTGWDFLRLIHTPSGTLLRFSPPETVSVPPAACASERSDAPARTSIRAVPPNDLCTDSCARCGGRCCAPAHRGIAAVPALPARPFCERLRTGAVDCVGSSARLWTRIINSCRSLASALALACRLFACWLGDTWQVPGRSSATACKRLLRLLGSGDEARALMSPAWSIGRPVLIGGAGAVRRGSRNALCARRCAWRVSGHLRLGDFGGVSGTANSPSKLALRVRANSAGRASELGCWLLQCGATGGWRACGPAPWRRRLLALLQATDLSVGDDVNSADASPATALSTCAAPCSGEAANMLSTGESSKSAVCKLSCRVAVSAAHGIGEACFGLARSPAGTQSGKADGGCASGSICVADVRSTGCPQAGPLLRRPEGWLIKLVCPVALRLGGVWAFCVNVSATAALPLGLEDSCNLGASLAEGRNSCALRVPACG